MRSIGSALTAALLCIGSPGPATAANQTREPSGELLPLERLGSEHGLSHNSVYAILQDRQGFLWFGTQDGLNRYDGREFVAYKHDPEVPASLASSLVTSLLEDRTGRLWVGTATGLDWMRSDSRQFDHFELGRGTGGMTALETRVEALLETPDGTLWVGTRHGLFRIDARRERTTAFLHDPDDPESLADNEVRALELHPDGTLWVLTHSPERRATLHRFDGRFERIPVPFSWTFRFGPDGLWIDSRRPIGHERAREFDPDINPPSPTTAFALDHTGRLWIGTFRGLYVKAAGSGTEPRQLATTPSGERGLTDEVHDIVEDRAGGIWIGTYGGVLRHDPNRKAFRHIGHLPGAPQTLGSNAVSAVRQDADGNIWIGTYGTGVDQIQHGTGEIVHHRHTPGDARSLGHDYVWCLALSSVRTLWVGVSNGLYSLEADGTFERHNIPTELGQPRVMEEGPDGRLWIGTFAGLYAFDPTLQTGRLVSADTHHEVRGIDALHLTASGTIWLASAISGDVGRYDTKREQGVAYRAVVPEGIWDIVEGEDGSVWLASGAGLFSFDPTTGKATRIRPDEGEPGSVYYSVLIDDDRLWLGTNKGLVRFDPSGGDGPFTRYDRSDGIGSVEFNRHAAFKSDSGELFFGGMNGLTIFQPSELNDNPYVPPVALTAVEILSHSGERSLGPSALGALTLSPDDYTVTFEFAALSYTQSEQNRYAYMLEGFDDGWIDTGTRPFVRYTSLPPGSYVFRARGSNNDGLWNNEGVALAVRVLPPYWQTWWFRLGLLGFGISLLTLAYRLRVRRLLQLERVRLRIASDLHDELGSELSGIALASSMLGRQPHLTDRDRRSLAGVESTAVRVMQGLRDIVWYINPEHDTLQSMEQRMRAVARNLLDGTPCEFHSNVAGLSVGITMDQRREIFLIYRELLHNVVRHAEARRVTVRLEVLGSTLRLEVTDHGAGTANPTVRTDGTGLRSIRRRATEIGGDLTIDSKPGRGTRASLVVGMGT